MRADDLVRAARVLRQRYRSSTPFQEWAGLTDRQMSVAVLVSEGYTDKQIAAELDIAENTVGNHVTAISGALRLDRQRNVRVQITRILCRVAA